MARLRVGVSGVGAMGARHASNLRRLIPGAELVAVADADRKRAAEVARELEISTACGSIDELVQRQEVQAVVIASPGKFHSSDVATAAAAGKHIFSEKPLG